MLPDNKIGFAKPVELVNIAIAKILTADDRNNLSQVAVTIIPGGRSQDLHSSCAYLELAHEIKSLDPTPHPDLLADWMKALSLSHPLWEVVWAPQKKGKDHRMTVRFCVADSKEKVLSNATEKIRTYLGSKGHRTTGGYISYNGLVDINFANLRSVDTILASTARQYIVPTLSKEGMHVSSPKFISVNNPFELCIGGLTEYEGLQDIIEKWLYYKYVYMTRNPKTLMYLTPASRPIVITSYLRWTLGNQLS